MRIEFLVQGSSAEPYVVLFEKNGRTLAAHCSCPAGEFGKHCKHRIAIINGLSTDVVSANKAEVKTVADWFKGSEVEKVLKEIKTKEKLLKGLEDEIKSLKSAAAALMNAA